MRHVELGAQPTDAGSAAPAALPDAEIVNGYGCPTWIDAQLNALRTQTCAGSCDGGAPANPFDLNSKLLVLAGTAGWWEFCGEKLGPKGAIGMEFAPGCRIFFLRYGPDGGPARGTEADWQADFDIFDPRPAGKPAQIDLHYSASNTVTLDVEAFQCPDGVTLTSEGRTIHLSRIPGDDHLQVK